MGFVGSLLYKEGRCGVTRKVGIAVRSRAGQSPAPTGGGFYMLRHSHVVIGGTIWRESRAKRVVIRSTICRAGVVIGSTVWGLLSTAQFVFSARGCYSRHSSKSLLFTAHFRFLRGKPGCYRRHICVWGCYSRHNSAGLLSAAQLPLSAAPCPFKYNAVSPVILRRVVKHSTIPGVVIGGTFPLFCCCYPQHISFLGCYRRHNSKNVVIYGTVWKKAGLLFAAHFVLGLLDPAQLW